MVGAVAQESPVGRFVSGGRRVIIASEAVSESVTETGASKPALPARQSNTKLRCQSIGYGERITVVDVGAAGAGVTTVVEARGGDDVVSLWIHPAKPMSANGNRNMRRIRSLPSGPLFG
jgi:hypothetical protein